MSRHWRWLATRALVSCTVLGLLGATPLPAQQEGSEISVSEHGVGTNVVDRVLEGKGDTFTRGMKVWFWTRVVGGAEGDRINHVWLRDGKEMLSVGLSIGGSHWRTWSHKTLHSSGEWAVEARDAEGRVLARDEFTCLPAGEGEGAPETEAPGEPD